MSASTVPRIAVVDDPLAPVERPRTAQAAPRPTPAPAVVEEATVSLAEENTTALFARLPASLVWDLEQALHELMAANRRHRRVTRQELVGALLWRELRQDRDLDALAELLDAYRHAPSSS